MPQENSPLPDWDALLKLINADPKTGTSTSDINTKAEAEDLDNQHKKAQLEDVKQDTEERKKYAFWFFLLACVWITIVTVLLLLQGFGLRSWEFKLSDPVMLAVIGSTTVNILGILYVVANYLFPKR